MPFDFNDLNGPVPYDAWLCQPSCSDNINGCLPIDQEAYPYTPYLEWPSTFLDILHSLNTVEPDLCSFGYNTHGIFVSLLVRGSLRRVLTNSKDPPQLLTIAPALTEPHQAPTPTTTQEQQITADPPAPSGPVSAPAQATTSAGPAPSPLPTPKDPSTAQQQPSQPTPLADSIGGTTSTAGIGGAIVSVINRPPSAPHVSSISAEDPPDSQDSNSNGGIGAAIISMINQPPGGSKPTQSSPSDHSLPLLPSGQPDSGHTDGSDPSSPGHQDPSDSMPGDPASPASSTSSEIPRAIIPLPSTTLVIIRESNNANVLHGTTMWAGDAATIGTHTLSMNNAGVIVDGNTAAPIPFITSTPSPGVDSNTPAPQRAVVSLGVHTKTLTRGPENLVTVDGQALTPGAVMTLSAHTLSLAQQGLVIDGTSTVSFGPAPTSLPAIVAVAGQTVVLGGAAVTAAEKVVSYGSKGLVVGTETIAVPTADGFMTLGDGEMMRVGPVTGLPGGNIGGMVGGVLAGQEQTGAASVPVATSGTAPIGKTANTTASVERSTGLSTGVGRQSAASTGVAPSASFPASSGAVGSSTSSCWMAAVIGLGAIVTMYI